MAPHAEVPTLGSWVCPSAGQRTPLPRPSITPTLSAPARLGSRHLLEARGSAPAPPRLAVPLFSGARQSRLATRRCRASGLGRLGMRPRPPRGVPRPPAPARCGARSQRASRRPGHPASPRPPVPSLCVWRRARAARCRRWRGPWPCSASGPAVTRSARKTVRAARPARAGGAGGREGQQGANMARPWSPLPCAHPPRSARELPPLSRDSFRPGPLLPAGREQMEDGGREAGGRGAHAFPRRFPESEWRPRVPLPPSLGSSEHRAAAAAARRPLCPVPAA